MDLLKGLFNFILWLLGVILLVFGGWILGWMMKAYQMRKEGK